jgi:mercuric ion transport protein
MPDRALIAAGLAGAIAAAMCCAAPMLAVTLGATGLMARLTNSAYVLIPVVLLICLALIGLRFRRRRTAAAGSDPATSGQVGRS